MTSRDLLWRGLGAALYIAGGCCALLASPGTKSSHGMVVLLGMAMALFGVVLLVQGKKAPLALKVESSRHRLLPSLIRARRRERRGRARV